MERPRDITGFRSRAINAGYAWTDANRPVAGDGASVRDVAGGRMVSFAPDARIPRPRPWDAVPFTDGDVFGVYLYTAPVIGPDGNALGYDPSAEGFSELAAVAATAADNGPGEAPRLSVSASNVADGWIVAEANEDFSAWRLALDPSRAGGERAIPVADLAVTGGTLASARALHSGAVDFLGSGIHFGDAEDAGTLDSWNVADGKPAILKLADADGNVIAKVLVDSRGNIVSWEAAGDGGEPADPAPRQPAPPCGNPLNDTSSSDDNPLEGGGGGGESGPADDRNPLNDAGDGGYTPECDMEAA